VVLVAPVGRSDSGAPGFSRLHHRGCR